MQFTCPGKNTENNITCTVPVEKEVDQKLIRIDINFKFNRKRSW